MRRRGMARLAGPIALVAALFGGGCRDALAPPKAFQHPVRLATARALALRPTVTATGFVTPWTQRRLAFGGALAPGGALRGALRYVVAEGVTVTSTQVLARIDPRQYDVAVSQAEAAEQAARAVLRELEAGTRAERLRLQEGRVAEAKALCDKAKSDLERQRTLYKKHAISAGVFEAFAADLKVRLAQLQQAESALQELRAGARPERIALARARLDEAHLALRLARLRRTETELRSPVRGVVADTFAEAGEQVAPGVPVLVVEETSRQKLVVSMPDVDVVRLRVGQEAAVFIDALDGRRLAARVERVASSARGAARAYRIELEIALDGAAVRPGMYGRAEIFTGPATDRVVCPLASVVARADGRHAVFVLPRGGNAVVERTVDLGRTVGLEVEVRAGLDLGESVVVEGQAGLLDGDLVRVAADAPTASAGGRAP